MLKMILYVGISLGLFLSFFSFISERKYTSAGLCVSVVLLLFLYSLFDAWLTDRRKESENQQAGESTGNDRIAGSVRDTLENIEWVRKNEVELKKLFPKDWTKASDLNILQIGFGLKLCGVEWRTDQELLNALAAIEKKQLLQRDGAMVRRNPDSIFREIS